MDKTTAAAWKAGYKRAKADAVDRCHIERGRHGPFSPAVADCINAIEALHVGLAFASKDRIKNG